MVGGRRVSDPPTLLLFGCKVTDTKLHADAYLVLRQLRKGTKPRCELGGRVVVPIGLKPAYINWEPITLDRCE